MAEFSTRVVTVERNEFLIPSGGSIGACWVEILKAVSAMHQELWERGLVPRGKDAADNTIRVIGDDENIILFYTTEKTDTSTCLI